MTHDKAHKAARAMSYGSYGSFAEHLGNAYLVADPYNKGTILEAFLKLFETVVSDIEERV
jgi:hypothetical protein